MASLVSPEFWEESNRELEMEIAPAASPIRLWIEKHIRKGHGDCFEVGCFPGHFLAVFGELGYRLNGIDLVDRVQDDLPTWLNRCGYRVGRFYKMDFFDYHAANRFDIVCSFGFIEHFADWQRVLIKQASLVAENGYLIVETPNFRGIVQRMFHALLDRENYKRHNTACMNPALWAQLLIERGFEIVHSGYIGPLDFWVGWRQNRSLVERVILYVIIYVLLPLARKVPMPQNSEVYSSICGLVAKKLANSKSRVSASNIGGKQVSTNLSAEVTIPQE